MPTGTGKTVTGLLIAEWVRRHRQVRTAYACPTRQLARYVARTARKEGIPAALLIGSHRNWPLETRGSYTAAEAVAVTTYSTIFNSDPKLPVADLLVFDDAHAGEQYVGEQHAVTVSRSKGNGLSGQYRSAVSGDTGRLVFTVQDRPVVGVVSKLQLTDKAYTSSSLADFFEKTVQPGS